MSLLTLPLGKPITADGTYRLADPLQPGSEAIFQASGAFGSGTLTLGYLEADGATVTNYPDSALTARGGRRVDVPASGILAATLAGATAPSITLTATKARAAV
jgi:hypothetical protein